MRMIVVSSAPLIIKDGQYFAYGPYVAEMALWARHVSQMDFVCPVWDDDRGTLVSPVPFAVGRIYRSKDFNLKSLPDVFRALFWAPFNFWQLWRSMRRPGHIHLRCPGNLPLMGCIVQSFFPRRCKSAKYAGNWDPLAAQPASYRFQKWWLANTFLTRKMQVMVYGQWPGASANIRSFFTATYRESEKAPVAARDILHEIKLIFVGTLSPGKRPLYAVQLAERLRAVGIAVGLDLYGNGSERPALEDYIASRNLYGFVKLMGNQPAPVIADAYRKSHFVVLASRSEGWPKAVAEAMFWGCLPLSTAVSCVPYMLGDGARGELLTLDPDTDAARVAALLADPPSYALKVDRAVTWSRRFTVDLFEEEIRKLLDSCE